MHKTMDYAARIRERGYRLTPQREIILDAVCEGGGPTTFEEIYARVKQKASAVDPSTVYRALKFFVDLQLVVVAEASDQRVYEIALTLPYYRLVCRRCGRFVPLDHDMVERALAEIQQRYGFTVDHDHLVLHGLCWQCRVDFSQEAIEG